MDFSRGQVVLNINIMTLLESTILRGNVQEMTTI
jgi:hypothetical protein